MKTLLVLLLWCFLFIVSWPLAILALVLLPLIWLVLLPFRLAFVVVEALLALFRAILFLPARIFGHKCKA